MWSIMPVIPLNPRVSADFLGIVLQADKGVRGSIQSRTQKNLHKDGKEIHGKALFERYQMFTDTYTAVILLVKSNLLA